MRKLLLLFVSVLFSTTIFAQTAEIENVRKREFRGVYPIINKSTNEVKGYYTFYVNEKIGGGMIEFNIRIYDPELELVKETPITITKRSQVDGAEYNGQDFLFLFNDVMKKTLTYVTVDQEGEIITQESVKEEKYAGTTADVFTANDGFYIVKPFKDKKWGYKIRKIDNELNELWEVERTVEKGMIFVEAVESGNGRIIIIEVKKKALLSAKAQANILCLDDETGDEIYSYSLFDGTDICMPTAFLIDENLNVVTGGMYFEGEKWDAVNSDGIFFLKLDAEGEQISFAKYDWDKNIQSILKSTIKNDFRMGSKPKVIFHEIVEMEGGEYRIIGETFTKNYQMISSGLKDAITGRFIGDINSNSNNNKPYTFEILDFVLFKFNNDADMLDVVLIPKDHTKISCYPPYNGMGGIRLAKAVKDFGFFNYAFVTTQEGSEEPLLVSANFLESDSYIGINTIDFERVSEMHKIPIKRKTFKNGSIGVMFSKPGRVGVYLYSKKEETIYIYFEDIKL
ncbi:MAG: hypothetical protein C0592_08230 [Marinilabiliales bacterium]|nr:MAG: hypothetical protein C0592_08230 [Marinilabiliales bacterium]